MSATYTALVIGASRGLGLTLAAELVRQGWTVIATSRRRFEEMSHIAETSQGRLRLESLEMTDVDQLDALRGRLAGTTIDLLFVNAAINRGNQPIHEVRNETFTEVMITNALSPLRVLEALRDLVPAGGTIAVMSSEQGSITRNDEPGFELYKASKAALNQLMRSYATRHVDDGHTKLLIDPGHNQTDLGGPDAPLLPRETIPAVLKVIQTQNGISGLQFLDRHGQPVPW